MKTAPHSHGHPGASLEAGGESKHVNTRSGGGPSMRENM